jgi:hypothetical protein
VCQRIHGGGLDAAIGQLLVEMVSPVTLEVALTVQKELESRAEEAGRLRQQEVESARYAADLAQRRYMHVDPDNRMVADALEADWNGKLRALADAQDRCEHKRQVDRCLDEEQRAQILALATDFPSLWSDPRTPDRERKRMARLLIEDVTLLKADDVTVHVRFKGGATRTLSVPPAMPAWMLRRTSPEAVSTIDRLLDDYTDGEIAGLLNDRGLRSGEGKPFHHLIVARIRKEYELKNRYHRLRARGLLDQRELAEQLDVKPCTIKIWRRAGLLVGHRYDDRGQCLFEPPGAGAPMKYKHQGKSHRKFAAGLATTTQTNG